MDYVTKGERRARKRHKQRYGHKVRGKGVFTLQREIAKKAEAARDGS